MPHRIKHPSRAAVRLKRVHQSIRKLKKNHSLHEEVHKIEEQQENILKELHENVAKKLPDKFLRDDVAQQVVGAMILSAPLIVANEVWHLSQTLDLIQLLLIVAITMAFNILLLYYTNYQIVAHEMLFGLIPLRIFSLVFVSYATTAVMLLVLGVIGNQVFTVAGTIKLVVFVGLFANIGAATADLLR